MAYKIGNPALNKNTFNGLPKTSVSEAMTLEGKASKSLVLFLLCVGSGFYIAKSLKLSLEDLFKGL